MKLLMKVFLAASILGCAATSNANLIVNGGFEDSNVGNNQWKWFTSANVNGWSGSTIEVWDSLQGFDSQEGEQHAELNAHGNNGQVFSIYQSFATTSGVSYDLSFAYAARTNNNEQFSYSVGDSNKIIATNVFDNNLVKEWTLFETSFVAIGSSTDIMFTSITPSTGTLGNFLDNVIVTGSNNVSTASVSAPTAIALMLAGVFGLIFSRRKAS
jgi:hypothetical protein